MAEDGEESERRRRSVKSEYLYKKKCSGMESSQLSMLGPGVKLMLGVCSAQSVYGNLDVKQYKLWVWLCSICIDLGV